MNSPTELLHSALVFGFVVVGAVGVPGVLLIFVQMAIGGRDGADLRTRR